MKDLTKYLVKISLLIKKNGYHNKFLLQEISNIAVDNWVKNSIPDLSKEQLNKVFISALIKDVNLN